MYVGRVIIIRGLPGSGKSTEAESYGGYIVSADQYFIRDGKYCFDASKIGAAHNYCMAKFLRLIREERGTIVVDNTNTKLFELTPYRLVALASDYEVIIVRMLCDPHVCAQRNTHGVPKSTILNMDASFEDVPAFLGGERLVHT